MPNDFYVLAYQVSLFPNPFKVSDVNKMKELITSTTRFSQGTASFFTDMPEKTAFLNLKTSNESASCLLSKSEFEFSWFVGENSDPDVFPDTVFSDVNAVLKTLMAMHELRLTSFSRIGFITAIAKNLSKKENGVNEISGSVLTDNAAKSLTNFQLHLTYPYQSTTEPVRPCNNVIKIFTGNSLKNEQQKLLVVQQDLNTNQEIDIEADQKLVQAYMNEFEGKSKVDDIKALLWPTNS